MHQIFAVFSPGNPTSTYTIRKAKPMALSGTAVLFQSVLRPKDLESARSPLFSALIRFSEIFRDRKIVYTPAPEPTPWTAPRQLKVPRLPTPPFYTFPPPPSFGPKTADLDEFEPRPLVREIAPERPQSVKNSETSLKRAQSLPLKGKLRQDPSGFVYLEVSPEFASLIEESGFEPIQPFIPVILAHEARAKEGWGDIKELGQEFSFTLLGAYSVEPANWPQKERVWFFTIDSPELSSLREQYLHPTWPSFHLTVGAKKRLTTQTTLGLYRLNVSCHAA